MRAGQLRGDVVAALHAVPGHVVRGRSRVGAGGRDSRTRAPRPPERGRPRSDSPPRVRPRRARMEDRRPGGGRFVEAVDRVARARRLRVSGRGQDHGHGRVPGRGQQPLVNAQAGRRPGEVALRRPVQQRAERRGQARQDRLGLRVAETGVELEKDRAFRREHQAGVQGAAERQCRAGPARPERACGPRRGEWRRGCPADPARGCRRPSRPCSVRRRRRASRLWSRAGGRASASWSSHRAIRLASRPSEPLLYHDERLGRDAGRGCPGPTPRALSAASALDEVVADRDALARHQAVGLDHDAARTRRVDQLPGVGEGGRRASANSRPAPSGRRRPRRPRGRTPCSIRCRAAARVGPKTGTPASSSASTTPAASGASGPTTTRSTFSRVARSTTAAGRPSRTRPGSSGPWARRRWRRCPGPRARDATDASRARLQARACSRPPPPRTRTREGPPATRSPDALLRAHRFVAAAGADAAPPRRPVAWAAEVAAAVRSSGGARARPRPGRSARRRAARPRRRSAARSPAGRSSCGSRGAARSSPGSARRSAWRGPGRPRRTATSRPACRRPRRPCRSALRRDPRGCRSC